MAAQPSAGCRKRSSILEVSDVPFSKSGLGPFAGCHKLVQLLHFAAFLVHIVVVASYSDCILIVD